MIKASPIYAIVSKNISMHSYDKSFSSIFHSKKKPFQCIPMIKASPIYSIVSKNISNAFPMIKASPIYSIVSKNISNAFL